ncbi:hypothetical protein Barb6_01081 [Bacteroidales bacterium Barb6]|nr:hypothetical protein Barb6_01081 [Bacteroidales bacterium Barb6]
MLEATGGKFNMFRIVGVSHYETIHSVIIAELLNPKGSHGLKEKFLEAFVRQVGITNFNCSCVSVEKEFSIGDGRLDILIKDSTGRNAIIIENKIYTGDQDNQLKRYDEWASEKYGKDNYHLFYLTLFGGKASEQSMGGTELEYKTISHSKNIISWLDECVCISAKYPLVRETINQYINHIKQLTGQDMDTMNREELMGLLAKRENVGTALSIVITGNNEDFRKKIIHEYIEKPLRQLATDKNLELSHFNVSSDKKWAGWKFKSNEWKELGIGFTFYREGRKDLFWGITTFDNKAKEETKWKFFENQSSPQWPCGTSPVKEDYRYWHAGTLKKIIDNPKDFTDYIGSLIDAILEEAKKRGVEL